MCRTSAYQRQHTAAHCKTLQHTATHCNALQHTATHCNTLKEGDVLRLRLWTVTIVVKFLTKAACSSGECKMTVELTFCEILPTLNGAACKGGKSVCILNQSWARSSAPRRSSICVFRSVLCQGYCHRCWQRGWCSNDVTYELHITFVMLHTWMNTSLLWCLIAYIRVTRLIHHPRCFIYERTRVVMYGWCLISFIHHSCDVSYMNEYITLVMFHIWMNTSLLWCLMYESPSS